MELFRRYCTGDGAVAIRMLSNPDKTLVTGFGAANFEDENYNIQVPVFTVHGNHDDPSRDDARKVRGGPGTRPSSLPLVVCGLTA